MKRLVGMLVLCLALGCGAPPVEVDDGGPGSTVDSGKPDAGVDAGDDAGEQTPDADVPDADVPDAGVSDAGVADAGKPDAGKPDSGVPDAGPPKDAGVPDAGPPPKPTTALLRPTNPMPCADPAVVSQSNAAQVFFVYCTGMGHVWKTTDWTQFTDVRSTVTFNFGGLSANGKQLSAWWAPGIVYSPALQKYVMWVSVPDAQATNGVGGWSARSLAVFTAAQPTGPWNFDGIAINAAADQHFIDPFLFINHDGLRYVYWKQYGGGVSSSIMGARVDPTWTQLVAGTQMEVMNGYGGAGTWEDNVRENPTVWYDPATKRHHMLFSGGHWDDDSYATGHAVSSCGPLCPVSTTGGWHMANSGDRGILQVVRAPGNPAFKNGGPGGAVFLDDSADDIIYAAAAKGAGVTTRYLMRDKVQWKNDSPYVNTAGHEPLGY